MLRTAILRGHENHRIGFFDSVAETATAIALSQGGFKKRYTHSDHNEDSALYVTNGHETFIAVADAHNGYNASEDALDLLLDQFAPQWINEALCNAENWQAKALDAIAAANNAIIRDSMKHGKLHSHTTLAFALVRPAENFIGYASLGDSLVFQVTPRQTFDHSWSDPKAHYLGSDSESADSLRETCICGTLPVDNTLAMVLATDGVSYPSIGVADPVATVNDAVKDATQAPEDQRAQQAAQTILNETMAAQIKNEAGDNIAAAIAWIAS